MNRPNIICNEHRSADVPVFNVARLLVLLSLFAAMALVLPSLQPGDGGRAFTNASPVNAFSSSIDEESRHVVTWTVPLVNVGLTEEGTAVATAPGYAQVSRPGWARVPFTSTLIALPPDVVPRVSVIAMETASQAMPAPLALAPCPKGVLLDDRGRPVGGGFVPTGQSDVPGCETTAGGLPDADLPVLMEDVGTVRGVRLVRLSFFPALPADDGLQVTRRIRVVVSWTGQGVRTASAVTDSLVARVRAEVSNPEDVIPVRPDVAEANVQLTSTSPTVLIEVSAPGLYRVSYDDVADLGLQDASVEHLHLRRAGEIVAYAWDGDSDDVFEPDEALRFYAEPRFSRWTAQDVYHLTVGDVQGTRMSSRSGDPTGLAAGVPNVTRLFEENHLYTPNRFAGLLPRGRDGDRWVWDYLDPNHATGTYDFVLDAVDTASPAELTLWLIGYTESAHLWEVAANGTRVGNVAWSGQTAVTATLSLPSNLLLSGSNTLSITVPGMEGGWLDAFAIHHRRSAEASGNSVRFASASDAPRAYTVGLDVAEPYDAYDDAYDVSDPQRPQRLSNPLVDGETVTVGDPPGGESRRYLVVAENGLRSPDVVREAVPLIEGGTDPTGADYLVISHPDFIDDLDPLVSLRRSQGLSVVVVNVLGIYDAYGDGRPDPEAIRTFIRDAYATWVPQPTWVLLVGDGSYDPRQYKADSTPTFIPPYLADADPWAGETAADNRYACVDGDDTLPDLLLGRLPVKTAGETQVVVDKIVAYETDPFPGGWNADVVLVADDEDTAGDFSIPSDGTASYVGAPFTVTRRYCGGASADVSDCSAAERDALYAALLEDWHQGALLMQFTGHASWQQWAAERFLHLDDLAMLSNDRRLPLVAEMTCFTGAYHRPELTFDETLLIQNGGGAVTVWGPTGLGVDAGHTYLSQGFVDALFSDGVGTVGEAALSGKIALTESGQSLDLLDTFLLLGDPALRPLREILPWPNQLFLPLVARGQ